MGVYSSHLSRTPCSVGARLFVKSGLRRDRALQFDSVDDTTEGGIRSFTPVVIADSREIPLQVLERTELRQTLQLAIASLPQTYRETLLLRDVEELSIRETAAVLGVSEGLVKTRLFRARLMMQKILLPQRGLPSTHLTNAKKDRSPYSDYCEVGCVRAGQQRERARSRRKDLAAVSRRGPPYCQAYPPIAQTLAAY